MGALIIFLDFDGVLHPQPCPLGQLFQSMPLFADALRRHPCLFEIVISSSWRLTDSLQELKARFPEDLRSAVIDVTPNFSSMSQDQIESMQVTSWENLDIQCKRQREIEHWLRTHRPDGVPWLAIDDMPDEFSPDRQNLLLTHPKKGLQPSDIRTLDAMIRLRRSEL
jgi:BMFP domain-containing protein YqiC